MKNKIIFGMLFLIFIVPLIANSASAEYIRNQPASINVICDNNGLICSPSATCNLSVLYSNNSYLIFNKPMTNLLDGTFNYSLTSEQNYLNGEYSAKVNCIDGIFGGIQSFNYLVTSTGKPNEENSNAILIGEIFLLITFLTMSFIFNKKWWLKTIFLLVGLILTIIISQTVKIMADYQFSGMGMSNLIEILPTITISIFLFVLLYFFIHLMVSLFQGLNPKNVKLKSEGMEDAN